MIIIIIDIIANTQLNKSHKSHEVRSDPTITHREITQKSSFEARASSKSSPAGTRTGQRPGTLQEMVYICISDGKIMGKLWFMACLWFIYHYIFILNGKIMEYCWEDNG